MALPPVTRTGASAPPLTAPVRDPVVLSRLQSLATLLDRAVKVPGTNIRVGLDPLIGLIPGGGDVLTGIISLYVIGQAARLGVSRSVVARMVGNVLVDVAAGAVPLLGDAFDVAWRANSKNVDLLTRHLQAPEAARRESRVVLWGMVALALLAVVGGIALSVYVFRWMMDLLR